MLLNLKNSHKYLQQRTIWLDDLENLLTANRVKRFAFAEKISKIRSEKKNKDAEDNEEEPIVELTNVPRQLLEVWGSFWRDVMISASGSQVPLVNIDRIKNHPVSWQAAWVFLRNSNGYKHRKEYRPHGQVCQSPFAF